MGWEKKYLFRFQAVELLFLIPVKQYGLIDDKNINFMQICKYRNKKYENYFKSVQSVFSIWLHIFLQIR